MENSASSISFCSRSNCRGAECAKKYLARYTTLAVQTIRNLAKLIQSVDQGSTHEEKKKTFYSVSLTMPYPVTKFHFGFYSSMICGAYYKNFEHP